MQDIEGILAQMTDHTGTVTTNEHQAPLVSIRFGGVDKNTLILTVHLGDGAELAKLDTGDPLTVRLESGGQHFKFECAVAGIKGSKAMAFVSVDNNFIQITVDQLAHLQVQKRRHRDSMSPMPSANGGGITGYSVGIPRTMVPTIVAVLAIVILLLLWHTGFR